MNGQLFTGHHGLSATSAGLSLNEFIACFAKEKTEPLATRGTPLDPLDPLDRHSKPFSPRYGQTPPSHPVLFSPQNMCRWNGRGPFLYSFQSSTKCPKHADATTKSIIDRSCCVGMLLGTLDCP